MHRKLTHLQKVALWGLAGGIVLAGCGLWYLHSVILPGSPFSKGPYAP